jgi:chitin disaccharide deacetylase
VTRMRALVVNADDFGLSEDVNAGVLRAHRHGIVTATSLMVRGAAAEQAVAAAAAHPALAIGLHVDLAEWVCVDGRWRAAYEVVEIADPVAVAAELERQLERFRALTGRDPTHLDSHQHVHRAEPVRSIMGARAKELRVPLRHHGHVRYCGAFYGQGRGGAALPDAITPAALVALIEGLPDGATELCCHPAAAASPGLAYGAERLRELEALCHADVRAAVARSGVRLGTFREALADLGPA